MKNNSKKNVMNKRYGNLGHLSSKTGIVRIDKFGEDYVVIPPIVDRKMFRKHRTLRFSLGDMIMEKEVEKLLKRNNARGGITIVTRRALSCNDDNKGGVWPPFIPQNIKIKVEE